MSTNAFRPAVALTIDCMAQIGMTRHEIMGIRFEGTTGGNPAPAAPAAPIDAQLGNPPAPVGTPPQTPNAPTVVVAPAPAAPANPTEAPPAINAKTGKPYTAAETQAYITELRDENRTKREEAATAQRAAAEATAQRDKVLAALGLKPDGTKADLTPEQLQSELENRGTEKETMARENLVLRVASKSNIQADADKMLDSRAFNDKLSALKSDDKAGIEILVTQWVTDHPEHKVTSAAASSGGTTHTGTTPPTGRKNMADAVASNYKS